MAISLYGDESESSAPHVFTLAGFIASPSAWDRARDDTIPIRPTYQRFKEIFDITRPEARPLYRQRLLRCYDKRFVDRLRETLLEPEYQPITDDDTLDLWYHMDAPED